MENVPDRFKERFDRLKSIYHNFQSNGTPIRDASKNLRESIEINYKELVTKTTEIEGKYWL